MRGSPGTVLALSLLLAACDEPRAQLVVVLDTDAVLAGQLALDPALSPDAVIDTVRVEALDARLQPIDSRDLVHPDPADWPLSFGFPSESARDGVARLRIRAFRAALAPRTRQDGATVLEPRPEVTLERFVEAALPARGVVTVEVLLAMECMGQPSGYMLDDRYTCVDADRPRAPPGEGLRTVERATRSRAGSWPGAGELPCRGSAPPGAICIPGGFTVMGDPFIAQGIGSLSLDTVPLRPVRVSPFWMDRTEFTVGRLRSAPPRLPPALKGDPSFPFGDYCTWLGANDAANDALPVNCIPWQSAAEACRAAGGDLPSESQWEHAARGRGQRRRHPWGNASPGCCAASLSRGPDVNDNLCVGMGVEPVGAHAPSLSCALADESRDGVLDLGGSVEEHQLDSFRPYDDPCWSWAGIALDPVCRRSDAPSHAQRGGDWSAGYLTAISALRRVATQSAAAGFRCVYPDRAP